MNTLAEPTCSTHSSKAPSRIDYILVSPLLVPFVCKFDVTHATGIPTHSPIRLSLRVPDSGIPRYELKQAKTVLLPDGPEEHRKMKSAIQAQ